MRETKTYKLGDEVKIKPDSEFAGQSESIGTITKLKDNMPSEIWYDVEFEDGIENNYRYDDLYLVHRTWKSRMTTEE